MKTKRTNKMVFLSLLAGISYLLMFFEVPILPLFSWLKLDFSDIPVLIGTFLFGPASGILVAFIRSTLHFVTKGGNIVSLIGDTAGFLATVSYLLPLYYIMKPKPTNRRLLLGIVSSTLLLTVVMSIANFYVITPFYLNVLGFDFGMPISTMVLYGIVPFNLIKGTCLGIVFFFVYKKVLPILEMRLSKSTI